MENNDEYFYNFESPMFAMVNPNDVLPIDTLYIPPLSSSYSANTDYSAINRSLADIPVNINQENFIFQQSQSKSFISLSQDHNSHFHHYQPQTIHHSTNRSFYSHINDQIIPTLPKSPPKQSDVPAPPPPPPPLTARSPLTLGSYEDDAKSRLQRELQKLSQKRRDRLKARSERQEQPVLETNYTSRCMSDKKMTSRERQLELERQESQQLELRKQLLQHIDTLEQKCNKLREILENIVATSPEYNAQMLSYLESSELLLDKSQTTSEQKPFA